MTDLDKFIEQLVVTNNPGDSIPLGTLYNIYFKFCMNNNLPALGKIHFSGQIEDKVVPRCSLGSNVTGFRGIQLSDDLEWFLDE